MSVKAITLACDTPGCYASCMDTCSTIEKARDGASERSGWSHTDGLDYCGPCSRGDAEASVAYYAKRPVP